MHRGEGDSVHEFVEWPKTNRLFRDVVVTEKLDGTNSAIHISALPDLEPPLWDEWSPEACTLIVDGIRYVISAQSRRRVIAPGSDNYGFAAWVYDNAETLVGMLGEGLHFGEWWGQGIQRRYGRPYKTFSLFNTERWKIAGHEEGEEISVGAGAVSAVPVLYEGVFSEGQIRAALTRLRDGGSVAAPGFLDPEGVCIFHTQTRNVMKVTLDNNDAGKWEAAA